MSAKITEKKDVATATKPRRRRWRWIRRALVVALLFALVVRAALPTLVASAARSWAEDQGLDLDIEEIDFGLTSGRVSIWGVELAKDGDRALHVETIDLDLDMRALLSGALMVRRAEIDGVDARLERDEDGALTLFSDAPPAAAKEDDATSEDASEPGALESLALPFGVHAARVQRVSLEWKDAAVDPPVELVAELDLAISDLGTGPGPARARLRFAAPGAIELVALDAALTTTESTLDGRLQLDVSGVHGGAAEAYLAGIGLEPPARAQDLRIEAVAELDLTAPNALDGVVEIRQSVGRGSGAPRTTGAETERAPDTWLELASVRAEFAPDTRGTAIEIVTEGLALEAERAPSGRFVLAGFVLGGGDDAAADETDADDGEDEVDDGAEPSPIRLVRIAVTDAELALVDRAIEAGGRRTALAIDALDVDLEGEEGLVATLDARVPDVLGSARVEARFGDEGGTASLELTGLTLEGLRPYLAAADLEPSGASCDLTLLFETATRGSATVTRVTELALVDGPRTALEVSRIEFEDDEGVLGAKLEGLVARLTSEAPGRTTFGPLRIGRAPRANGAGAGAPAANTAATNSAATSATATNVSGTNAEGNAPAATSPAADDGRVAEVRLDARLVGLDTRGAGEPATAIATLTAPGLVDAVELEGRVGLPEQGVTVDARLAVAGLREAALAALRPDPSIDGVSANADLRFASTRTADGSERLEASIEGLDLDGRAGARALAFEGLVRNDGGTRLEGTLRAEGLAASDLELTDATLGLDVELESDGGSSRLRVADLVLGDDETSLRIAAIEFASTLDADGGTTIDSALVRGVEVDARRRADGALVVAGAVVVPARSEGSDASGPDGAAGVATAGDLPATEAFESDDDAFDATSGSATTSAVAPARLALGTLSVDVDRFEILDVESGRRSRARVRLSNAAPAVLYDPVEAETPLTLRIDAALEPGLERLAIELTTTPDESGLDLALTLDAQGLSDRGLIEAWPDLAATLVDGGVEDGRLSLALDARVDAPRTSATGFDLRRLVGASVELRDATFLPVPDAPPGFALASARLELRSLGGDGAPLRLGEVELADARVVIEERDDATSIAGLRLRRAPEPTAIESIPEGAEEAIEETADAAEAIEEAPPGPGFAIDHLIWTGLDLEYVDVRHDPPTRLPVDTLDVDVRNLLVGAPLRRPMQFRAALRGAAIELPEPPPESNILSSLARELTGSGETKRSSRRWLDELVVSGDLKPGESLQGWVRTELYGFELLALERLAAASGVKIGGGTVDSNVRVDLRGAAGERIKSRTTFTALSVQEPPDGPISRFLRLPAPLDVVLWVLRNERGEQVVPLSFTIDESGVSTTELVSEGTQALVLLITDALASSPLRLGGGLLDIVGFDPFGDDEVEGAGDPVDVAFDSGATRLDGEAQAALTNVLRVLAADESVVYRVGHVFAPTDLERAHAFAVPDATSSAQLAARLEIERDEFVARLVYERERLARLVATGAKEDADALATQLRANATELDELERTLDTLYALSVPADARTREKRERAAAQRLAERRFESIVRELFARGAGDTLERLQFVRPRAADVDDAEGARGRLVFTPRAR